MSAKPDRPILFGSDFHFHNWKAHATLDKDGNNSRLMVAVDCLNQMVDKAVDVGAGAICLTGDTFHVRGAIRPSVLNKVHQAFQRAVWEGISLVVLAGNHDMELMRGGATAIDTLSSVESDTASVITVGTPQVLMVENVNTVAIPYIHDVAEFKRTFIALVEDAKPDMILLHQGIDEALESVPRPGVTADWLNENGMGARIFSGHYHAPYSKGNVVQVGAPYHQNFGDTPYKMGCWAMLESGAVSFSELHYPAFVTIDEKFKAFEEVRGCIVRVKAKSSSKAKLAIDRCRDAGALDVVAVIEKEFKIAHSKAIELSTPTKMFEEYLTVEPKYAAMSGKLSELFKKVCLA